MKQKVNRIVKFTPKWEDPLRRNLADLIEAKISKFL